MSHYNLISSGYLTVIVGYVPCWWGFSAESCLTLPTPWTVAHQAPLCVGFPRQEYWSHGHFLCQEIFQTQGSNPGLLHYRQILHQLSYKGSPQSPLRNLKKLTGNVERIAITLLHTETTHMHLLINGTESKVVSGTPLILNSISI